MSTLTSGISVGIANTCTAPFDMIKVRMQLYKDASKSVLKTGSMIIQKEGVLALWNGVIPVILRGFTFGGLRLGLYGPIQ